MPVWLAMSEISRRIRSTASPSLVAKAAHFLSFLATLGSQASSNSLLVANRLKTALRPCDSIARLGGDEFVTLLRCINLLETPSSGTLRIGEASVTFSERGRLSRAETQMIRQQTGMVFQNFQLFPHRTAIENVMEGLITVLRWPREKARERAVALLEKVGMAHKADAWPATLSGGQHLRFARSRYRVDPQETP